MEFKLNAFVREPGAGSKLTELRQQGFIPGTYYGQKIDPVSIYVKDTELREALHTEAGSNVLIDLNVEAPAGTEPKLLKGKQLALIKEMQKNPIMGDILHVDFVKVSLSVEIQATVPVVLTGEAAGVKTGGVLQHSIREVTVKCLPTSLPDQLEIDVSQLEVGDSINVSELPVTEGVEIIENPEEILVSVVPPTKVEEVVPAEEEVEEEELEPEVIGEKKEEGQEPGKETKAGKETKE